MTEPTPNPTPRPILLDNMVLEPFRTGGPLYRNTAEINPRAVATSPRGIFAVGDSLTVLGRSQLVDGCRRDGRPLHYNAQSGRPSDEGLTFLIEAAEAGWLPQTVAWLLGTNDTVEHSGMTVMAFRHMLKRAGKRKYFMATVYARISNAGFTRVNNEIALLKKQYPNNLFVLDWASMAAPHPEWFIDNVHTNALGSTQRTAALLKLIRSQIP